jgi:type VI secretion system protein ImpH
MRDPADPVTALPDRPPTEGEGAGSHSAQAPRASAADPLPAIAAEPYRFDFFHAMRLIEAHHPHKPRLGTARRPVDEPVRLGQAADLSFAPSSIASVDLADRGGRPCMKVRFFGLFGPNGPLPLHLTTFAHERKLHKGDETFGRFADLFHHRLLLLFYRAWAQAQPSASLDRPQEDRFADYVGALVGVGGAEWRRRDALPDHARLAFAGVLSRQVRNADGLAQFLARYLARPVRVEQFVGRWLPLQQAERTRIGGRGASRRSATAQLGVSTVLGGTVFDRQHHVRIHIGPLSLQAFESLLPVGSAMPAVKALIGHSIGHELGWDLRLELDKDQVPACRPGRHGRLGWTTWLGAPRGGRPAAITLVPNPARA